MIFRLLGCLVLLGAGAVYGQTRDSVVMRDTLVQSYFQIEHRPLRAGVEPGYGRSWYSQNWYSSDGIPAPLAQAGCDQYDRGTGNQYGLTIMADIPSGGDQSKWSLRPEVYFNQDRLSFTWTQSSYARPQGTLVRYNLKHEISATLDEFGIAGEVSYELYHSLSVHGGLGLGYSFHGSYDQLYHLDSGNTFFGGSQDSTFGTGTLPKRTVISPNLLFGVSYEIPLSKKLRVQPTLDLRVPLRGPTNYWSGFTASLGLNFLLDLTPRTEVLPVYVKRQVPVVVEVAHDSVAKPPALTASIEAMALDENGHQAKVVRMQIEEIRTRNAFPILNYIFFDEGSSAIASRYVRYTSPEEAASKFQGSSDRTNAKLLDLYHETLNILGDRLKRLPQSKVTLIGSTSNVGVEQGRFDLARSRAETVRDYLERVWQIAPSRIAVEAALLPKRPSPLTTVSGQEENRRVEIVIEDDRGLDPITVTNVEHLASPDQIILQPKVSHPIASYTASIHANGVELQAFHGDSSGSSKKVWSPTEENLKRISDSLLIEYDVVDSIGNRAHAHNSIPLNITRVTSDRKERVQRFSLILFDFDQSKIGARNDRQIENIAKMLPKISVSRILIQGYTDESGEAHHNDELSEARAAEVRKKLQAQLKLDRQEVNGKIETEGRGSRDQLYDNSLPEGRFFSRTVNVIIERSPK